MFVSPFEDNGITTVSCLLLFQYHVYEICPHGPEGNTVFCELVVVNRITTHFISGHFVKNSKFGIFSFVSVNLPKYLATMKL